VKSFSDFYDFVFEQQIHGLRDNLTGLETALLAKIIKNVEGHIFGYRPDGDDRGVVTENVTRLKGMIAKPKKPVSIEEMNRAIIEEGGKS